MVKFMNWMEIALLIFGAGAFVGSFLISGKSKDEEEGQQVDLELIRDIIEKEMGDAKQRVAEVVDETLEYAVEKTERASERISNEKIMAISEYSETVLSDVNKAHQEVMFLYDMLNDKHNNLKETIKHVDKTAKEAEEAANAAAVALAAKARSEAENGQKEIDERTAQYERAAQEKAAREKEYARRQMARLILPMQQELPMHRQPEVNAMNMQMQMLAQKPQNMPEQEKPTELKPLVVKNVEIVSADIVNSSNMQPVSANTNVSQVSAVDLQTLGMRPEDMKVVEVKPAEIRQVEVYSFAEQAPRVERPVKKESQASSFEHSISMAKKPSVTSVDNYKENFVEAPIAEEHQENNNDRILKLHNEGMSYVDIAKELGLGVGEVKLVINLFKGAV